MKSRLRNLLVLAGIVVFAAAIRILAATPAPPGTPTPRPDQPPPPDVVELEFGSREYDFGNVPPETNLVHTLVFTNRSPRTIELLPPRGSCGCIRFGDWSRTVGPLERGVVPFEFRTGNVGGPFHETITLATTTPDRNEIVVDLRGTIWRPVQALPDFVVFPLTPDSPTNETAVVRLVNHRDDSLVVEPPRSLNPVFAATLEPTVPGREFELRIRAVRPLGSGNTYGKIVARTSSKEVPEVEVTVLVPALPAVVATPSRLRLPTRREPTTLSRTVAIRGTTSRRLAITNVVGPWPGVHLRLEEREPGRLYHLTATFPPDFDPAKPGRGEIALRTNDPQFPTLRIPVEPEPED